MLQQTKIRAVRLSTCLAALFSSQVALGDCSQLKPTTGVDQILYAINPAFILNEKCNRMLELELKLKELDATYVETNTADDKFRALVPIETNHSHLTQIAVEDSQVARATNTSVIEAQSQPQIPTLKGFKTVNRADSQQ